MVNINNNGCVLGNVSAIAFFPNKDGSRSVILTVAVDDNFTRRNADRAETQFIPFHSYIPAGKEGINKFYDSLAIGDKVGVLYRVQMYTSRDEAGNILSSTPELVIEQINYQETKAAKERRIAAAAEAQTAAQAAPTPQAPAAPAATYAAAPQPNFGDGSAYAPSPEGFPVQ